MWIIPASTASAISSKNDIMAEAIGPVSQIDSTNVDSNPPILSRFLNNDASPIRDITSGDCSNWFKPIAIKLQAVINNASVSPSSRQSTRETWGH